MWKTILILIIFNTKTGKFEDSVVNELKYESVFDIAKAMTDSKKNEFKFIKAIKDSVYIPNDTCYTRVFGDVQSFETLKP